MVTLGSLGTQSYFLNWLLAVAAPTSSYLTSPDSSATELSELWAILSHILAKVEKWRGHDCCYRRQFWVERVEKWCGKRSSRRMHHRCDRWTASWLRGPLPQTWSLLSALCRAGAALQRSALLIWRRQAAGCEIWAEFAPRGQCPVWPGPGLSTTTQFTTTQLRGRGRESHATHYISSPTPAVEH